MRRLFLILLMLSCCMAMPAQRQKAKAKPKTQQVGKKTTTKRSSTKKKTTTAKKPTERQQLEAQKKRLQEQRANSQRRQKELEGQVKKGLVDVQILSGEIEDKLQAIDTIRQSIALLDTNIVMLGVELDKLQAQLEDCKQHYIQSVRYMYRNRKSQNRMMFVFSAKNFNQMFRRMRFADEYSNFQRTQGEAVKQMTEKVQQKKDELSAAKKEKSSLLRRNESEHQLMEKKKADQKQLVANLQKEQKTVQKLISQQQQQEKELDARIEKVIQEEIARAKAEAKRKAEEERKRLEAKQRAEEKRREQAQARANADSKGGKQTTSKRGRTGTKASRGSSSTSRETSQVSRPKADVFEMPAADRALSGSFESNKGRLPMPITGAYNIVRGLGTYTVNGLKNVVLSSNGIYLQGKSGAQARCVFDGVVTTVVQRGNSYIVTVRHGKYISVYCNLASVKVATQQQVKTNQILGNIGADNILQFQLRNWTSILNPKVWLGR